MHLRAPDEGTSRTCVGIFGIVLATADGLGTVAIMRHTAKSKTVVWRWQERFAQEGVDGLCDKTRPSRVIPLGRRWPSGSWL
jgi:hypothetical protein